MSTISYPMFDLSTVVDMVKKARKAGKTINKQVFANVSTDSKNPSTTSGIFNQKLSSLKHYNLARIKDNKITFTELTDNLLESLPEAKKISFLAPSTFSKLYISVEKNTPLEINLIENIAHLQIGISVAGKRRFTKNFVQSGLYAGLIKHSLKSQDGYVVLNRNESKDTPKKGVFSSDLNLDLASKNSKSLSRVSDISEKQNVQEARLKLSYGKATIIVPFELKKEDKEKLKNQIDIF